MIGLTTQLLGTAAESNVTVGASTPVQLVAAIQNRKVAWLQNQGIVPIWLATTDAVAVGSGYELAAGATFVDEFTNGSWWALAASSTAVVRCIAVV